MAASVERRISTALPNFRCVYPRESHVSDKDVIEGYLFRSSRPDLLDEENADLIYESGVKTIIDLRPHEEYLRIEGDKFLDRYYAIYHPPEPILGVKVRYKVDESMKLKQVLSKSHEVKVMSNVESESKLQRVCLDFFKLNYILKIICSTPFHLVIISLFYLLMDLVNFGSKYYKNFIKFFAKNILNQHGLAHQYKNMADWSQAGICGALKIMNEPGRLPALIQCAHGKDRTGILVAIVLSLMGVSREQIVDDYHLSEKELDCVKDRLHYELCHRYGMREEFKQAKRETMQECLEYIDEKYGSVEKYLHYIGFGPDEQAQLRQKLNKPIKG